MSSSSTQPAGPPFAPLDAEYKKQVAEYEKIMQDSIRRRDPARLPELRAKSEAIQATLSKMIESLTYMRKETPDIRTERDALLEKLRRIQQDYSEMIANTDDMETLRRIREQENGDIKRQLIIYLFVFLFVATLVIVYMVFVGRKAETTLTTTATPTMRPALT